MKASQAFMMPRFSSSSIFAGRAGFRLSIQTRFATMVERPFLESHRRGARLSQADRWRRSLSTARALLVRFSRLSNSNGGGVIALGKSDGARGALDPRVRDQDI